MPLLKREPEVSAVDPFGIHLNGSPWVVAYLRSRQEKLFARFVSERGVPFYLPQYEKRIWRSGRTFVSRLPLFPGYVFLRVLREQRIDALRSGVVVRLIDAPDQEV